MKRLLILVLPALILGGSASAVNLKPTPVRDALYASLNSDEWKQPAAGVSDTAAPREATSAPVGGKSVLKAGLLSALIPGAGEYYLGKRTKAKVFFTVEALTWIGYISFRMYGNWKEDDYIRFGSTHAGASLEGKDDFYIDMVAFYDDIDQYNTLGRVSDPDRPYFPDTPEYHWRWQSSEDQATFRDLKNRSREAFRKSDFMVGVAILSRIVSVIDAVRDAIRMNRRIDTDFSQSHDNQLKLKVDPFDSRRQVSLTLYTPF